MSERQEIPHDTPEQEQAHSDTQGLEAAQFSEAFEAASSSPSPLMPDDLEEVLDAGIPDIPQSPQSACSTSTGISFLSSSKSDETAGSQEKEDSSDSSKSLSETESLPEDPLDEKVTLLAQFLLHKYQMFEPITKADMIDVVIKEYRDDFPEIFRRVSEYMELVFGVDVEEVDPTSHSYALVNKLGITYDPRLSSNEGVPKTSLLIMVLGSIFMKGNSATEEDIWEVLSTMNLHPGMIHFTFGEPRKLITQDLVQEKYLEYRQVLDSDPPHYEFLWGPRAHAEVSKMKLLEFLTKVNGSDPTCFPSQYEEALRDEAERAQAGAATGEGTIAMAMASPSATSSSSCHPE
ncbi:melanoma-associated antigen B16-like [Pteronotus mesoamericanus]|uniref:melanoma-associated antigen B16-like n=1 Tax=Pteronotus mesoamericanus TaxID=1884717 RepID=UPI0023EBF97F|nr:melanoma-associated antigen B16-like [Pteronotus parnellii mesoamericanus]